MMALFSASADMGFLLLRIMANRQSRRWALPHEAICKPGRGEACQSVLPAGIDCNCFTNLHGRLFIALEIVDDQNAPGPPQRKARRAQVEADYFSVGRLPRDSLRDR